MARAGTVTVEVRPGDTLRLLKRLAENQRRMAETMAEQAKITEALAREVERGMRSQHGEG